MLWNRKPQPIPASDRLARGTEVRFKKKNLVGLNGTATDGKIFGKTFRKDFIGGSTWYHVIDAEGTIYDVIEHELEAK